MHTLSLVDESVVEASYVPPPFDILGSPDEPRPTSSWLDFLEGLGVLLEDDAVRGPSSCPEAVVEYFDTLRSEYDLSPSTVIELCGASVLLPLEVLS